MHDFSFTFGTSTYFSVIGPVALGLAWVSPEPDLPLPSTGYAVDIKLSSLWSTPVSSNLEKSWNCYIIVPRNLEIGIYSLNKVFSQLFPQLSHSNVEISWNFYITVPRFLEIGIF